MRELVGTYDINGNKNPLEAGLMIQVYKEGSRFYPAIIAPVIPLFNAETLATGVGNISNDPHISEIIRSHATKKLRFNSLTKVNRYIRNRFGDFKFELDDMLDW